MEQKTKVNAEDGTQYLVITREFDLPAELVFQAIADPTRRAILLLVATQSMSAGAIAANFDTARPTVSKHLQILTECELLEQEQNGREIYYHINAGKMREIADFIEPFRKSWDDRFNKLESVMKKYKSKK